MCSLLYKEELATIFPNGIKTINYIYFPGSLGNIIKFLSPIQNSLYIVSVEERKLFLKLFVTVLIFIFTSIVSKKTISSSSKARCKTR